MTRAWWTACAVLALSGSAGRGQAPTAVAVTVLSAELQPGDRGVTVVATGAAAVPDGTRVRLTLRLAGREGLQAFTEVVGGRFTGRLGPWRARFLPGAYELEATVDPTLQRPEVAARLKALSIAAGQRTVQVGTEEEAAAEREKLRRRYAALLEELREVSITLDMWGSSGTNRSAIVRVAHPEEIPAREVSGVEREWRQFTEELFTPAWTALRFDQQQLADFVVLSYFPALEPVLTEILSMLDRMQAAFAVAIARNLGKDPPREVLARGSFSLADLRRSVRGLARQGYQVLELPAVEWEGVDRGTPERIEDASGDLFRSTVAKFQVEKPAGWFFDVRMINPAMRLRLLPGAELAGRVFVGIEIHDFPLADGFDELALLEEELTRSTQTGFQLVSSKRIGPPDATMPGGVRPGQALRYRTTGGGRTFVVLQHTLFCRWHKRTYAAVCVAEQGLERAHEAAFEEVCASFKVLDAPRPHGGDADQGPSGDKD